MGNNCYPRIVEISRNMLWLYFSPKYLICQHNISPQLGLYSLSIRHTAHISAITRNTRNNIMYIFFFPSFIKTTASHLSATLSPITEITSMLYYTMTKQLHIILFIEISVLFIHTSYFESISIYVLNISLFSSVSPR